VWCFFIARWILDPSSRSQFSQMKISDRRPCLLTLEP
jgi:hypothetical protein